MKKFLICLSALPLALFASGCVKKTDYFDYVSEYRKGFYFYQDDDVTLKIYCLDRETPYALDGVKGDMGAITEVYFEGKRTYNEVEVQFLSNGGEMSYLAVTQNYYLSFSGESITESSVAVTLTLDGTEKKVDVFSVAEEGVIDGKTALASVREYDRETFDNLTVSGSFLGEIYIRLLYDAGCFYYVGVCDRESNVHAYLVDGNDGRIIAEKQSTVEK